MLALFPKVPKTQQPQALKIDVFDYPTVVFREPPRISTYNNLYCEKIESLCYIFAADGVGLSSFKFSL